MWTTTYHRFLNRAAFLAACDATGWPRGLDGKPMPPAGATLVEIGPIITAPGIDAHGVPVPGDVLDARYHVNAAWHGIEPPEVFRAVVVTPTTPSRAFALPPPQPLPEPPVPPVVAAWKAKEVLAQRGLLDDVEAAVVAAGGLVQRAWAGAGEWSRDSQFVGELADMLGFRAGDIDQMFREADAIRS
jgi:hypothetical protein